MEDERLIGDVRRLKEGFGQLPEPTARPALIIISGLPGTGKSFFSKKLAGRVPSAILETDALRKVLFPSPRYTAGESYRLFRACYFLVEELLRQGIGVIFDGTNLVERHRERLYRIADELGVKVAIVQVEAPPELVRQRLEERALRGPSDLGSDADWTVYEKMRRTVQRIRRNHFVVDTSQDMAPVIDGIVWELRQ